MAEGYVIVVGRERPEKVITAAWDKQTQQPIGDQFETFKSVGSHLLINQIQVWGRRVARDKEGKLVKRARVEVTDTDYKGDIEFLKWGDEKGYMVTTRYLAQSNSLDMAYQDQIQKIKIDAQNPRDISDSHIELVSGENKFDYKSQNLLITHLKVHPMNRMSESKNPKPSIMGEVYYEKVSMKSDSLIAQLESGLDAAFIVKSASKDMKAVRNLFEIMGTQEFFGETDALSIDNDIYTILLAFAQSHPDIFFTHVNSFKKQVSDDFEKAKVFDIVDLTKDGVISISKGGKKEPLIEGTKGKGEDMIVWALENYYLTEVYEKLKYLHSEVDKKQ